ncbi:hypothetical protein JK231_10050 [Pantoea sp. JGM49]|nr:MULTISPECIES: hypothetical protein [unclassified Pantoea]MBS0880943.1 hypothetical protein [Pantoea sp. JGM49]
MSSFITFSMQDSITSYTPEDAYAWKIILSVNFWGLPSPIGTPIRLHRNV